LKSVPDEKVLQFYEDALDTMDAYTLMYDQLREWWLIGESFVYLVWDDKLGIFIDGEILPPEYVDVQGHPLVTGDIDSSFEFFLIPDESLMEFVNSTDETIQSLKNKLPPEIIKAVTTGDKIRINPFNLMVMMRKQSRYNPRGTSIILRCLKTLLYEDKIIEAQYAIADRLVMPTEIWKLGTPEVPPTKKRLEAFAELVRAMEDQPKRNLVTHFAVNYEIIGAVGKFPPLVQEFGWVEERILTALFTNKAITTGQGPTYANASVAMRALLMRYIQVRQALETSWIDNVFYPIAVANKMYKSTQAELEHGIRKPYKDRVPIIPEFDWHYKTNLLDDQAQREILLRLRDKNLVPMKTICESIGVDYETAKEWLKKEQGTVYDPYHAMYREALIKEAINPSKAPQLPPSGPKTESKERTKETEEEKMRRKLEKGSPEEFKQLVEDLPDLSDLQFYSRGGIKRKVKVTKHLLRLAKRNDMIGGKGLLPGSAKNNMNWLKDAPPEVRKGKKRKTVVTVRDL